MRKKHDDFQVDHQEHLRDPLCPQGNSSQKKQKKLLLVPWLDAFGPKCFLFGVIGFCLLQGLAFIVIQEMGIVPVLWDLQLNEIGASSPLFDVAKGFLDHDQQPILIIGGSDGSGTRAFVDTLRQLGAIVVADDSVTFDVHASEFFQHQGWPGLINAVINFTHSANFEWDDFVRLSSQSHADYILREIRKLMTMLRSKYNINKRYHRRAFNAQIGEEGKDEPVNDLRHKKPGKTRKVGPFRGPPSIAKPSKFPAMANGISFVIKAPVSMLVLPILCKYFDTSNGRPIKFLHVIRDGRDVALSKNQSPVLKFYRSSYPDYEQREGKFSGSLWNVRAMQLWNDWNTQVYEWAMKHTNHVDKKGHCVVDYMWMRSEDLLPGSPQRLECLHALADFVGSTLKSDQLCSLSLEGIRDYGKSAVHNVTHSFPQNHLAESIGEQWRKHLEKKNGKDQNRRPRRRLQDVSRNAKVVPVQFIQDVEFWRGLVQSNLAKDLEETKEFILDGLIDHGVNLLDRWRVNDLDKQAENLKDFVTKQEIWDLVQQLRKRLLQVRMHTDNKQKNEQPGNSTNVKDRYGKWQSILSNNTELANIFNQEGAKGLDLFGYHPEKEIHYLNVDWHKIDRC